MKPSMRLFVVAATVAVSGCKGGTRVIELKPIASAIFEQKPPSGACFVVEAYADHRENRDEIGSARNGFGMKLARAVTNDSVSEWMTDQLAADLRHAGAAVNTGCRPEHEVSYIRPTLHEAYVSEFWNISGTIDVSIDLVTKTGTKTGNFVAEHSQTSHFASTAEFTETLHKTLEALHDEVIPWLFGAPRQ